MTHSARLFWISLSPADQKFFPPSLKDCKYVSPNLLNGKFPLHVQEVFLMAYLSAVSKFDEKIYICYNNLVRREIEGRD